jgi:hypothetical protein
VTDKPVRVTKTDILLAAIEGLGEDKGNRPIGIRTAELADKTGVPANSIQMLLAPHVSSGRLCVCKVTTPGRPPQNEYRRGAGVPPPSHTPLNIKRAGAAIGQPGKPLPATTPAPAVSSPRTSEPATPIFLEHRATTPQAQVGKQRQPARGSLSETPPAVPAATVAGTGLAQTPKPDAGAALKTEPATRKASAGDALRLAIDQDGVLQMGDDDDPARYVFSPAQVLALGDFLHATERVWRP